MNRRTFLGGSGLVVAAVLLRPLLRRLPSSYSMAKVVAAEPGWSVPWGIPWSVGVGAAVWPTATATSPATSTPTATSTPATTPTPTATPTATPTRWKQFLPAVFKDS